MNYELIEKNYTYLEQDPQYKGESFDKDLATGPRETRKCRDCLCLLLYLAFLAALIIIGIYALANGNPSLLAAPFDSTGRQCGIGSYEGYSYAYFNKQNMSQFGCVEECPTSDSLKTYLMFNGTITQFPTYASIRLVSICFPTSESMANTIDLGLNFYDEAISDLQATWPISLATLFIALFVSIVLMLMIRALGRCLVFTIIALYFVILVLFGVLCFETADDRIKIEGFDEWKDPQLLRNIAYISWTIAVLSFLILLSTMVIKTTAEFTRQQCQSIFVPLLMFISIAIFFTLWIVISIYIFSCGEVKPCGASPYGCIDWNVGVKRSLGLYLFGLFWNCQVAIGMCQFVIASTTVYWYFSHLNHQSPSSPVCKSFCRALTYHLGSIAFGALILCILFILKIMFQILHRIGKNKTLSQDPISNTCMKTVIKMTRCCLACFERFIRFISKNAFIMMAITGEGFCSSAHQAFYLIFRSSREYSITHGVGSLIMFFGKLLVSLSCTACGYLIITSTDYFSTNIYSAFMPTVIFFVISYVVASLFMDVFAVGSDTILLCYCLELDILKGMSYACPAGLKGMLDTYRS